MIRVSICLSGLITSLLLAMAMVIAGTQIVAAQPEEPVVEVEAESPEPDVADAPDEDEEKTSDKA